MSCVFDTPGHPNGGCIFADPSEIISGGFTGKPKGPYDSFFSPGEWQELLLREDEELLLICRAFVEVIRCR